MSRSGDQMVRTPESEEEQGKMSATTGENKESLQGLPLESCPYVRYSDLEGYKRQAYGTEGHLDPKPGRRGGGTDAPILSGGGLSDVQASTVNAIIRQIVP